MLPAIRAPAVIPIAIADGKLKGEINLSTQGGLNNLNTNTHGIKLDDKGMIQGLHIKARPFSRLTGTLSSTASSKSITGSNTLFDSELEIGDIIDWNSGYWEISSINESQFVGGQTSFNHSVICNAFLVRMSHLNIERVRSI